MIQTFSLYTEINLFKKLIRVSSFKPFSGNVISFQGDNKSF